jgi:RNA polymerase sigma-70 factor (ECF subfamily)
VSTDGKNLTPVQLAAEAGQAAAPRAGEAALNQLMDRYAGGDDAVFRALHAELAPRLHRFLLRLTGSAASADELAQEAFLRIHRARGAFNRGGAALPWIYAVSRNVFLDHERKRKVHSAVVLDEALTQVHPAAASHRPDRVLESRRTLDLVRTTLAGLPVSQREAFILLRFEGLSVSDAAEVLGSTEASVKSRAFRAYEAIRRATREDETSGEAKD